VRRTAPLAVNDLVKILWIRCVCGLHFLAPA
jgi:hypothetical protein